MNIKGKKFNNNRLGMDIYVYIIEGKEWFIGKDIADILEYSDCSSTVTKKVNDEYKLKIYVKTIENIGSCQNGKVEINSQINMINEFGLYQLVGGSKQTKAIEFQKWIYEEVLPSIRKNNYYIDDKNIDSNQIQNLTKHVEKLKLEKNILHEILYDLTESTTMSFTEASLGLFGKDAKFLSKMLIEHGFLDSNKNIIKQEAEFTTPTGDKELIRIFTKTDVQRAKKDKDIRYAKITNFGYAYLKKYFITQGLSRFGFTKEELKIKEL